MTAEEAQRNLHHARGIISTSRHIIAVEEQRIQRYLLTIRDARIRLRQLAPCGDTEDRCRGIK
jgi:hypothetical protein